MTSFVRFGLLVWSAKNMDLAWSGFDRWAGDNGLLPGDGTKTSTKNKRACWRRCQDSRMGCVGFSPVIFNIHFLQTAASCFVFEPIRHYALSVIQRCETWSLRMQKSNWHCKDFWQEVATTLDSGLKTTPNKKQTGLMSSFSLHMDWRQKDHEIKSYRWCPDFLPPEKKSPKLRFPTTHGREGPHLYPKTFIKMELVKMEASIWATHHFEV